MESLEQYKMRLARLAQRAQRGFKRGRGRPPLGKIRSFHASDYQWAAWHSTAAIQNLPLSQWIRDTLDAAATPELHELHDHWTNDAEPQAEPQKQPIRQVSAVDSI